MPLLKRANEQTQSEWREVPTGLWRWVVGTPTLQYSEKFGKQQVRFPLVLTPDEQKRLAAEQEPIEEGQSQSTRTMYSLNLSLGYVDRTGQYKTTKLVDFLSACLGHANTKKFRDWIEKGGGPPRPEDKDDDKAELSCIESWLGWWEGLEVYGSISHAADSSGSGKMWARFAGPLPVGSLPGQRENEYQALGLGKLRMIMLESERADPTTRAKDTPAQPALVGTPSDAPPAVQFTAAGVQVKGDGSDELPF